MFVIIPLPLLQPGEHFKNILQLKVKYAFLWLCALMTLSITLFTSSLKLRTYFVSFASFFITKVYFHFFGYLKIKYRDDGRDYVSVKEFFAIHVTFSVLHSWLTYCTLFTFFVSVSYFFGIVNLNAEEKQSHMILHTFNVADWSQFSLVMLFVEMMIYLAYYKDLVFSLVTLSCYIGIYFSGYIPEYSPEQD